MKLIIAGRRLMHAVIEGKRTQTTRFWKYKTKLKPGDKAALFNYREKLPVTITYVRVKSWHQITDEDAVPNGYSTAHALKLKLFEIYGFSVEERYATIIGFSTVSINC